MTVREVHLLHDGYLELDMGMLVYMKSEYYGIKYQAALKPLLILTEDERILVDTGISPLPSSLSRHVRYSKDTDIVESLSSYGLSPGDISTVIYTHLHMDHCGNAGLFSNARHIVQRKELEYAASPDRWMRGGYVRDFFSPINFDTVEGDVSITDGVQLIETPGHTPGHQSVLILCGSRRIVYTGDTSPLLENIQKKDISGIHYDPSQDLRSIEKLLALGGEYIASHDLLQMNFDCTL